MFTLTNIYTVVFLNTIFILLDFIKSYVHLAQFYRKYCSYFELRPHQRYVNCWPSVRCVMCINRGRGYSTSGIDPLGVMS